MLDWSSSDEHNGFNGHDERRELPRMIVVLEEGNGLGLRRVRWRDRLVVRIRASALDDQLAAGASPNRASSWPSTPSACATRLSVASWRAASRRSWLLRMRPWGVVSGHPSAVARCSSPERSWPPSPVASPRRGLSESAAWHACGRSWPTVRGRCTSRRRPEDSTTNYATCSPPSTRSTERGVRTCRRCLSAPAQNPVELGDGQGWLGVARLAWTKSVQSELEKTQ